jgi:thiosulfate reductase cytochrome b subunit
MISSGLQIYNANPVFGGRAGWHFPKFLLLGGWLAGGRDWHFAIMWVYSLNLFAYGLYVLITRRYQHRFANSGDLKAVRVRQNEERKNYAWHPGSGSNALNAISSASSLSTPNDLRISLVTCSG